MKLIELTEWDVGDPMRADFGSPRPNMHRCSGQRKDGRPCGRWVPTRYPTCPWHRRKPTTSEQIERLSAWRSKVAGKLIVAQAMEAACLPECYSDSKRWKRALSTRKQYVRRFLNQIEDIDRQLASMTVNRQTEGKQNG